MMIKNKLELVGMVSAQTIGKNEFIRMNFCSVFDKNELNITVDKETAQKFKIGMYYDVAIMGESVIGSPEW